MILLLRIFLIALIIYLILRSFITYNTSDDTPEQKNDQGKSNKSMRRISKDVGEYIDFEEKEKEK